MARPSPPVHGLPEPDQVHSRGSCDCGAHPSAQRQLPSTPEMDTQMFVKVTASAIVEQVRFRVTQQRVVAGLQRTNSCYVLRTGTTCVGSNAEDVNVTQMQWVFLFNEEPLSIYYNSRFHEGLLLPKLFETFRKFRRSFGW